MGQIDQDPTKQKRATSVQPIQGVQDGLRSLKPQQPGNPVELVRIKLQDPIGCLSGGLMPSSVWSSDGISSTSGLFQRQGFASPPNNPSPPNSVERTESTLKAELTQASSDNQRGDNQQEHKSSVTTSDDDFQPLQDARTLWMGDSTSEEDEHDASPSNQCSVGSSFQVDKSDEAAPGGSQAPDTTTKEFTWQNADDDFDETVLATAQLDSKSPENSPNKSDSLSATEASYDTDSGFVHPSSDRSRGSSLGDVPDSETCPPPPGLTLMDRIQEDFPRTPSPVYGSFNIESNQAATAFAAHGFHSQTADVARSMGQLRLGDFHSFSPDSIGAYPRYPAEETGRRPIYSQDPGFATSKHGHPFAASRGTNQASFSNALAHGFQPQVPMGTNGYQSLPSQSMARWYASDDRFGVHTSPLLSAPVGLGGPAFPAFGVGYRSPPTYAHERDGNMFHPARGGERFTRGSHSAFGDYNYEQFDMGGNAYSRRQAYPRFRSPAARRNNYDYFHPVAHSYSSNSLLEEFNSAPKSDRWELATIRGHLLLFAKDQSGSRFIQQKLEKADERAKNEAFTEIYPNCLLLMTDVFGNYVIQKFLEYGTQQHQKLLVEQMKANMISLALQVYGCRVIQRALEVAQVDEQLELIHQLKGHVMKCVVDQNGNHVLQKCVEAASWKNQVEQGEHGGRLSSVAGSDIQFIIDSFLGHVAALSMHSYGCRVIQRVLEHCSPEQIRPIVNEIIFKCRDLIKDQFGNYVVQHVVSHGDPEQRAVIKRAVFPDIARWSQHKYASNVVEACLDHASKAEISSLVDFILQCDQTGESCPLMPMMKHMYGNYVVQKLLDRADDTDRERIACIIRHNADYLKRFTFGKHVLDRIDRDQAAQATYY